jgi:hypothetical protein
MTTGTDSIEAAPTMPSYTASPLPVIGHLPGARRAVGAALCYADDDADLLGEDRFNLLIVDAEGKTIQRLGPFVEDDVVAVWRDLALKAGFVRMIVREDGALVPVSRQMGRVLLGRIHIRRRHAGLGARRPRFLARRKTGRLPARPQIFRGEMEIIARS